MKLKQKVKKLEELVEALFEDVKLLSERLDKLEPKPKK